MKKTLTALAAFCLPISALAEGYTRPIPQAQSATAEVWFAVASVALAVALFCVAKLVAKR